MLLLLQIVSVLLLLILTYQDFKDRAISWIILPVLFICFILTSLETLPLSALGLFFGINSGFIFLQVCSVALYFLIKRRTIKNIIDKEIGLGDILFFIVLTVAFSPVNFIAFYVVTLILTLAAYLLIKFFNASTKREIPLAGIMSLAMAFLIITSFFSDSFNLYSDRAILSLITLQ